MDEKWKLRLVGSVDLPFRDGGGDQIRTSSPEAKAMYVDDLLAFLTTFSVLHATHPEDFFSSGIGSSVITAPANTTPSVELQQVQLWTKALGSLLVRSRRDNEASTEELDLALLPTLLQLPSTGRQDVRLAVKNVCPSLEHFATQCSAWRLNRSPAAPSTCSFGGTTRGGCSSISEATEAKRLGRILATGMCTKKKHEVQRMYEGVCTVVREHNEDAENGKNDIDTIVNIGEGKGYLSRTLALVKGLQVVGLDCNPHHRDTSFERVDRTMMAEIPADGDSFLYGPRGAMSSLTCRVGPELDWDAVLGQHNTLKTDNNIVVSLPPVAVPFTSTDNNDDSRGAATEVHGRPKVVCRLCQAILKKHDPTMMTHVVRHLKAGATTSSCGGGDTAAISTSDEIILGEWYVPFVHTANPEGKKKKEKQISNCAGEGESPVPVKAKQPVVPCRVVLERGVRVSVLSALLPQMKATKGANGGAGEVVAASAEEELLTVLGFDDSTQKHRMLRHHNGAKCYVALNNEPLPEEAAVGSVAVPFKVLAQTAESWSPIDASLKKAMMIGLHTCGNLGANSLKLWLHSQSPRLMLVSCCWHALSSPEGFPMSRWVQQSGFRPSPLSLMLATQPVKEELQGDEELDGYVGSKKLLFFRALLSVMWPNSCSSCYSGRAENREQVVSADGTATMLPPSFLRKIAKVKQTLTFADFVLAIFDDGFAPKAELSHKVENSGSHRNDLKARAEKVAADHMDQFSTFLGFFVLRMWVAQLVETALLLDRVLFLAEGLHSSSSPGEPPLVKLLPLFEGSLSPRNYAIIARRK